MPTFLCGGVYRLVDYTVTLSGHVLHTYVHTHLVDSWLLRLHMTKAQQHAYDTLSEQVWYSSLLDCIPSLLLLVAEDHTRARPPLMLEALGSTAGGTTFCSFPLPFQRSLDSKDLEWDLN